MSEFLAKYSTKKVPIIIENNIVEKSWSILDHSKRYLVITDSNLLKTYDELIYQIPNLITTIALKPGELAKSIEVYQKIITALTKLGVKRNDVIIAFGGGVIGDLVGFVACTREARCTLCSIYLSCMNSKMMYDSAEFGLKPA